MGHFTITLPNNSQWVVKSGYVFKKTLLLDFFKKNESHNYKRKGYVVMNKSEQKEYRLLKTPEGNWSDKEEAGFNIYNDETVVSIKKAIDELEKEN
jgi:hypothetical protein